MKRIRIVIVEDHEMVREGLKALINQWSDMEIIGEYNSGIEWLEDLHRISFDVVLIDINLPLVDGLTAIKQAITHIPKLKSIVLTMHNDTNYFREAFVNGACGFILKNQSAQDLEQGIRDVYLGHTFFSDEFLKSVAISIKEEQEKTCEHKDSSIALSDQELELLTNICKGYTNRQLAESMFLSVKSIESHKTKLMRKTNAQNNASLIVWAIKNHVVNI